jgi:hypothetical protein
MLRHVVVALRGHPRVAERGRQIGTRPAGLHVSGFH